MEVVGVFFVIFLILIGIILYLLPSFIAWYYKDKNAIWIFLLTLLTGWSTIGWIIALFWAVIERDGTDLIHSFKERFLK